VIWRPFGRRGVGPRPAGRRWREAVRTTGAALVVAAGGLIPAAQAAAGPQAPSPGVPPSGADAGASSSGSVGAAPGVQQGPDRVTLLSQSPWVEPGQSFHLQLEITAPQPAHEYLSLQQYGVLVPRSYFDEALSGDIAEPEQGAAETFPLSTLRADSSGGVDLDIPVTTSSSASGGPGFQVGSASGVYPIQIGLYNDNNALQGQLLTTFLVYVQGPSSVTQYPPLSVALVVPVHAAPAVTSKGQLVTLRADEVHSLANEIDTLDYYPGVQLSLAVTPQTVAALAGGPALSQSTLASLTQLVQVAHDQVLPSTYAEVPYLGWASAGLGSELTQQLTTGASVLSGAFGAASSSTTWVVNGPLDSATLRALVGRGARQLIVPDGELSPLPAAATVTTYAWPTQLVLASGMKMPVFGADVGLTADFSNSGGAALAANQLLAELAMIQTETPGYTRGVVVLPPPGWSANPTFLETLLAGLDGNPLLRSVTASGLFTAVPFSAVPGAAAQQVQRSLEPLSVQAAVPPSATTPNTSTASTTGTSSTTSTTISAAVAAAVANERALTAADQLAADAGLIRAARAQLVGFAAVFPANAEVPQLDRELLTAESSDVTEVQRDGLVNAVTASLDQGLKQITLPLASSITLTSTRGQIPLTVLAPPSLHARVELQLTSQRLIFQRLSTAGVSCQVPTPTSEICHLTLTAQNTTLKFPVETRASGVFPLTVTLLTADGSWTLAQDNDTVHSTAVSDVGLVLIVLAVLFLGVWWVRDIRHGRRARQLVPAPQDETEEEDSARREPPDAAGREPPDAAPDRQTSHGEDESTPVDLDPVVGDLFRTSAPDFEEPRSQPQP
jgi:Family of unknown function (DUF6049)